MSGRRDGLRRERPRGARRLPRLEALESRQLLAIFTVRNTLDGGLNSLRQAITDANTTPGPDTISFSIAGGGVHVIRPRTPLPTITDEVVIDGTTQPGWIDKPLVEIRGDTVDLGDPQNLGMNGLRLDAPATVRALTLNRWELAGIRVNSDNAIIQNCFIGTNNSGSGRAPNGAGPGATDDLGGIVLVGNNGLIGGIDGRGNLISGNDAPGIRLLGSANTIAGNKIGTDLTGDQALNNAGAGIRISGGVFNIIGGNTPAERNVISGNAGPGLFLDGASSSNSIFNNYIGADSSTGSFNVGNGGDGILAAGSSGNNIGGTFSLQRNIIAFNAGNGIRITGGNNNVIQSNTLRSNAQNGIALEDATNTRVGDRVQTLLPTLPDITPFSFAGNLISGNGAAGILITGDAALGNSILSNSIFGNTGLGIDLAPPTGPNTTNDDQDSDSGPNTLQNFPELALARTRNGFTLLRGTFTSAPNSQYILQFFRNDAPDNSGFGEGLRLLASTLVTTDALGLAQIDEQFFTGLADADLVGELITVTATDAASGNTSEFSKTAEVFLGTLANLNLTQTDVPDPAAFDPADPDNPLTNFQYVLRVTNDGPETATNLVVTDFLPVLNGNLMVDFVDAAASNGGTAARVGNTVVATIPALGPGAFATVTITVRPNGTTTLTNLARLASDSIDPDTSNNTSSETTSVHAPADVSVTVTPSPGPVTVVDDLVYNVAVTNNGPGAAGNVRVTLTLGDGDQLLDFISSQGTFQRVGNQLIALLETVPAGVTVPVRLVVRRATPGSATLIASVQASELDKVPENNNPAQVVTPILAAADVRVVEVLADRTLLRNGDQVTLTARIRNAGPSPATGVTITSDWLDGLVFTDVSVTPANPGGPLPVFTADAGPGGDPLNPRAVVTLLSPLPSDPEGGSDLIVTLVGTVSGQARLTDLVRAAAAEKDQSPGNNTGSVELFVDPADLAVRITPSSDRLLVGDPLTYTVAVTNNGPAAARDVVVSFTVPDGVTIGTPSAPGGEILPADPTAPRVIRARFAQIAPFATDPQTLLVPVTPTTSARMKAVATVASTTPAGGVDPNAANDRAELELIPGASDIVVDIQGPSGSVALRDAADYTVVLTNRGPAAATNVAVDFPIPGNADLLAFTPAENIQSLTRTGANLRAVVAVLPVGGTARFTVQLRPTGGSNLVSTATATPEQIDSNPADNSDSIVSPVVALPGVAQFAQATYQVAENGRSAVVTVTRTGGFTGAIAVTYQATGGTAVPGLHYSPVRGSIQFADGEQTKTFTVPIFADGEVTGPKTVDLILTGAVGAQSRATLEITETDTDTAGPRLVSVGLPGNGAAVTALALNFSEAIEPGAALNPANYSLIATGRGGGPIAIAQVAYTPGGRTVAVVPSRPLANGVVYVLTFDRLTDRLGNAQDGNGDGIPGGAATVTFARGQDLTYADPDGDVVRLRLRGPGVIELVNTSGGEGNRLSLTGTGRRSILTGNVRRGPGGNGVTLLGDVDGLGAFNGGARSRLTSPPFLTSGASLAAFRRRPFRLFRPNFRAARG